KVALAELQKLSPDERSLALRQAVVEAGLFEGVIDKNGPEAAKFIAGNLTGDTATVTSAGQALASQGLKDGALVSNTLALAKTAAPIASAVADARAVRGRANGAGASLPPIPNAPGVVATSGTKPSDDPA